MNRWATAAFYRLDPATIAVPGGEGLVGFFVRSDRKQHGLQRWIEGCEVTLR